MDLGCWSPRHDLSPQCFPASTWTSPWIVALPPLQLPTGSLPYACNRLKPSCLGPLLSASSYWLGHSSHGSRSTTRATTEAERAPERVGCALIPLTLPFLFFFLSFRLPFSPIVLIHFMPQDQPESDWHDYRKGTSQKKGERSSNIESTPPTHFNAVHCLLFVAQLPQTPDTTPESIPQPPSFRWPRRRTPRRIRHPLCRCFWLQWPWRPWRSRWPQSRRPRRPGW